MSTASGRVGSGSTDPACSDLEVFRDAFRRFTTFVNSGNDEIRATHHVAARENFRVARLEREVAECRDAHTPASSLSDLTR